MNKTEPVLEAAALTKRYRRGSLAAEAISQVSFSLLPGEILGVVGQSGSGKSTLLRQLACLEKPTSGRVMLCGRDVTGRQPRDVCHEIQMVFQNAQRSFDPRRSVGASVCEAVRQLSGLSGQAARERCAQLIRLAGLDPSAADAFPSALSGGQCQRFAIARALAAMPKVLLCDEATSELDVSAQAQIVGLLAGLRDELGLSIVFVSHDLALVSTLCSRILVLQDGAVAEQGPTQALVSAPRSDAARALLAAAWTGRGPQFSRPSVDKPPECVL